MNAYYMILEVRDIVGEDTASHWDDIDLLRKMNFAHRQRANELMSVPGDWLVTSEDLTPVASVITLPTNCVKPVYLEEASGGAVIALSGNLRDRRATRSSATTLDTYGCLEAYPVGNTLEVNQDSYTDGVTLWFQKRIADLHMGTESSVSVNTLGFHKANFPRYEADYYNGVYVEVMDATTKAIEIRSLISDYTAAGVATITGTPVDTDVYGTVSELPEEADNLVILEAALAAMVKPSSALDPKYFEYILSQQRAAKKDWKNFISTRIAGSNRTRITEIE